MKFHLAGLVVLALLPCRNSPAQTTYLGVAVSGSAHLLQAVSRNGSVEHSTVAANALTVGSTTRGLSMRGNLVRVRIDSIREPYEPPDAEFFVTVQGRLPVDPSAALYDSLVSIQDSMSRSVPDPGLFGTNPRPQHSPFPRFAGVQQRWLKAYSTYGSPHAVLLWSGPDAPTHIPASAAKLDSSLVIVLRRAADSLWRRAVRDLPPDDQRVGYRFGRQEVSSIAALPDLLYVWIQAVSSRGDSRGSFFFIVDSRDKKIVVASFGHPEWSPNSSLIQTRPYLFFTMPHDPRLFLLVERAGAWEDYSGGWAVLDASNGRLVATSN